MVSSTINAVASQRLVRRICPECKIKYALSRDSVYRRILGDVSFELYHGEGCGKCGGTGYKGRIPLQELLVLNDNIRENINCNVTPRLIEVLAIKDGMQTIYDDGIAKAVAGLTTLDEVHRVLHFNNL